MKNEKVKINKQIQIIVLYKNIQQNIKKISYRNRKKMIKTK